jgi:hypothetical protein
VKYTLFPRLAFTLGVCAIPNVAFAQYTLGDAGQGLTGGPNKPAAQPGVASIMITGTPVAYQGASAVGSGVSAANTTLSTSNAAIQAQGQSTSGQSTSGQSTSGQANAGQPISGQLVYFNPQGNAGGQPQYIVADRSSLLPGTVLAIPTSTFGDPAPAPAPAPVAETVKENISVPCTTTSCAPAIQSLSPWIFGANGLVFNRLDSDCTALTYNSNDPTDALLCTRLVDMPNTGGFELSAGRYFGCGRYALMGSYWGVFSAQQEAVVYGSPTVELMPALGFTYDSPWGGSTAGIRMASQWVSDWYNQANVHRVTREQTFQNAEINFVSFALGGGARQPYGPGASSGLFSGTCSDDCGPGPTGACAPWYGAQCSRLRLNMFAGLRWFQFQDQLEFGASDTDAVFDYSNDDFFYRNEVTNNLFGGQLGATATWCTGRHVNLFTGTSFGVYNNRMSLQSYAGTANEIATIVSANAFNGQQYSFSAHDNDIAVLGEGNVGAGFRITRGWTANVGYRLVGVSGVATSVSQIPRDFANLNSAWHLKNDNSILLHGLTVGAAYNF